MLIYFVCECELNRHLQNIRKKRQDLFVTGSIIFPWGPFLILMDVISSDSMNPIWDPNLISFNFYVQCSCMYVVKNGLLYINVPKAFIIFLRDNIILLLSSYTMLSLMT